MFPCITADVRDLKSTGRLYDEDLHGVARFESRVPSSHFDFSVGTGGLGLIQWREDSRELDYLAADGWIMAVEVSTQPTFRTSPARPLFQVPDTFPLESVLPGGGGTNYPDCSCGVYAGCEQGSISRDGQRVVLAVPVAPDRRELSLSPDALDRIAGRYDLRGHEVVLDLAGDHLVLHAEPARRECLRRRRTNFSSKPRTRSWSSSKMN